MRTRLALLVIPLLLINAAHADEGMWLFNAPPTAQLKEKYGFEPTPQWLDHLQKASVRFNSGGSGSFVSAEGLCITNHHVGADALQKFSDEQHNYLRDGFYAATRAEEKPCLDLELNVLMSIEDVTDRVKAAIKPGMSPADAVAAARGQRGHRKRVQGQNRPAFGRRYALRRRRVPTLPFQTLHRRSPGVCPRAGHRFLRRRSGQF